MKKPPDEAWLRALLVPAEAEEREQEESQRKEREESNVREPLREVRGHLEETPGCEDDPARAHESVAERDVQNGDDPDQGDDQGRHSRRFQRHDGAPPRRFHQ